MKDAKTKSYKITPNSVWVRINETEHRGNKCMDGNVITPHGIVNVMVENDKKYPYTMLEVVAQGRVYRRFCDIAYSKRYVITLAQRFAREIVTAA